MALKHYDQVKQIPKTVKRDGLTFRLLSTHENTRTVKSALQKAKSNGWRVRGIKVSVGRRNQIIYCLYVRKT